MIACMQGGSVRSINGYQPNTIMESQSTHSAWPFSPAPIVKREPMEDDSGITSGSEFHSSSPGSESGQEVHHVYQPIQNQISANIYPSRQVQHCASPTQVKVEENQDHLRRLEISLEKSLFTHKPLEQSVDESSNNSDNEVEEFEEQSWKFPKVNSHGKPKFMKCKQCDFVTDTKEKYWNHIVIHIPEEKRLTCPKCPFITEYKHHLEYHLRWHAGSKPFQCNKCDYTCVNKSMLNSHMKSHSNVYRYSCRDCSYATKYCHSLKIHLRRYEHRPNVVLDEDGKPCPDVIIDVYGTRRGPKMKNAHQKNDEVSTSRPEALPFGLNLLGSSPTRLPFSAYPFFGGFPNAQLLQQLIQERQNLATTTSTPTEMVEECNSTVLDLSKPNGDQQKNRRKGPAFRIDPATMSHSDEDEGDDNSTTMFSYVEAVVENEQAKKDESVVSSEETVADSNNNKGDVNSCQYCNISFGDPVLYTIHMGYHGFRNPFTCNMCGVECSDKISFFLHIARVSH